MSNKKRKQEIINYWTNIDSTCAEGKFPDYRICGFGAGGNHDLYYLSCKKKEATLIFHGKTCNYVLLTEGHFIPLKIKTLNKIMRRLGHFGQCRPKSAIKHRKKKLKAY